MKKILIIEDEELLAGLYSKKLKAEGFDVKTADTAEKGEEIIKDFKPDIIYIDHTLKDGGKDGIEAIPDIKKAIPKARIILLTNHSQFQMEDKAKKAGAEAYLVKLNTTPAQLAEYTKQLFI